MKYLNVKKIGTTNSNFLVSIYISSIEICKKYNIFNRMKDYMEKTYINNMKIKELYQFENLYFKNLESSHSIDI